MKIIYKLIEIVNDSVNTRFMTNEELRKFCGDILVNKKIN
jgi:hypothetical protein